MDNGSIWNACLCMNYPLGRSSGIALVTVRNITKERQRMGWLEEGSSRSRLGVQRMERLDILD